MRKLTPPTLLKVTVFFAAGALAGFAAPTRQLAELVRGATMDYLVSGHVPSAGQQVLMSNNASGNRATVAWQPAGGNAIDSIVNGNVPPTGPDAGPQANSVLESYADGGAAWVYGGNAIEAPVTVGSFSNSWVNASAGAPNAKYWEDPFGMMHIRGEIKSGTLGVVAFQLDAAHKSGLINKCVVISNGAVGWMEIDTSGNVIPEAGSNTEFNLQCDYLK